VSETPRPDEGAAGDAERLALHEAALAEQVRAMERFRFTTTRPVAVLMVFLAVMVFGGFSVKLLPLNLMPEISYPKLTVRAEYPGAAPAEVENDVARPLEEVLGVVTGVTRIESVSRAGFADVALEFTWDTNMDDANQDVLEKLDQVKPLLPDDVKQPLILRYDPTLDPVLVLGLSGTGEEYEGTIGLKALRRLADREVKRLLEPIDGVAAVRVRGGLEEEIHVELDEDALRRTGIGIAAVIQRLQAENINLAGGSMREGRTRYLIRTVNEFANLDEIRNLVIVSREGRDILLRHLASVSHGYKDRDVVTHIDAADAVEIEVYKEADANIVEMAKRVRRKVDTRVGPRLEKEYGADVSVVADRSLFIESSISEVWQTAIFGGVLAVVVLFFFLRSARTTAIVAAAIPISVLVTFAPLNIAEVSLNIMSLGGLALGIGMLVDNSIVVLESIHRCREEGDDIVRATIRGTAEVGPAVTASTLTSIAVFFPMVFVKGVAGQMFGDLGLTVVFSLLASLAVALFFIPMLASRVVSPAEGEEALGFFGRLRRRWTHWNSVTELKQDGRRHPLVLPYYLVRFGMHLAFEIIGKTVATFAGILADAGVLAVGAVGWVMGRVLRPFVGLFEIVLDVLTRVYRRLIRWSLRNSVTIYVLALGAFGLTFVGAGQLDSELIPEVHQGEFSVELAVPVGTPIDVTEELVRPIERKMIDEVPRLRALVTTIGAERDSADVGDRGEHSAKLDIALLAGGGQQAADAASKARSEAKEQAEQASKAAKAPKVEGMSGASWERPPASESAEAPEAGFSLSRWWAAKTSDPAQAEREAMAKVREILSGVPDLTVDIERPVLFSFKDPIEVEIRGWDLQELYQATDAVAGALRGIGGLRDVEGSIRPGNPEVQIEYDRDALSRLGLDIRDVAELIRNKIKGDEATKFNRRDRKIPIRVRLAEADDTGVDDLRGLVVNPGGARPIPLSAVATVTRGRGPNEIRRIGQQRVGLVTANVEGVGLGSASDAVHAALDELELPSGVTTAVTGQTEEWETSSQSLYLALALSVFLVYVIMASQFESLLYPVIILVSIPLALTGVVAALWLGGMPLSVVVFLGVIMLAGIVVNNAIVLVDYVNQLKARGHETEEALELAGVVRLRPILMTTATTVLGLLPMALGLGDGAEIRQPMAVTVIAGLVFSTLLTLVIIPTIYSGVDRLFGRRRGIPGGILLEREIKDISADQLSPEPIGAGVRGEEPA
jgi:HAE1 family hydrophobic/amphiphilic exporter-1